MKPEKPWKRISFVYGYAVYDRDRDTNVDPVFVRANEEINRKRKKTETEQ